jgi:mannose-6-phosphate isomerase-like protein (cupin superfamily)
VSGARSSQRLFDARSLRAERQASGKAYLEFLRRDTLSAGLYELAAGATDPQAPHTEDELYMVLEGRASLRVAGVGHPVEPGAIVFVEAGVDHCFEAIESDLSVLVFFAPPEGSGADRGAPEGHAEAG